MDDRPEWKPCEGGDACPNHRRGVLGWLPHDHFAPPTGREHAERLGRGKRADADAAIRFETGQRTHDE